jgi:hypothetical protein
LKAAARALPTGAISFSLVETIFEEGAPAAAAAAAELPPPKDFFTVFSTTAEVSVVPCFFFPFFFSIYPVKVRDRKIEVFEVLSFFLASPCYLSRKRREERGKKTCAKNPSKKN